MIFSSFMIFQGRYLLAHNRYRNSVLYDTQTVRIDDIKQVLVEIRGRHPQK